jgi:hypothetical protein
MWATQHLQNSSSSSSHAVSGASSAAAGGDGLLVRVAMMAGTVQHLQPMWVQQVALPADDGFVTVSCTWVSQDHQYGVCMFFSSGILSGWCCIDFALLVPLMIRHMCFVDAFLCLFTTSCIQI